MAVGVMDWIKLAVNQNYLIPFLITSRSEAKLKSIGLPYGVGKSTLAFWIAYKLYGNWDKVFENAIYYPHEFEAFITPGHKLTPILIWDDIQFTCPDSESQSKYLKHLVSHATTSRTELRCLIGTADCIGSLARPIERFFIFEIIVSRRGIYEFHHLKPKKDFDKPYDDLMKLLYKGESEYPPFPKEIEERYDEWRTYKRSLTEVDAVEARTKKAMANMLEGDLKILNSIYLEGGYTKDILRFRSYLSRKIEPSLKDEPTLGAKVKRMYYQGLLVEAENKVVITPLGKSVIDASKEKPLLAQNSNHEDK